jgi:arsenite methyltransferase
VEAALVNAEALRELVREKYREVATDPHRSFHFHTGLPLRARLGYDAKVVGDEPYVAVEFQGAGNYAKLS